MIFKTREQQIRAILTILALVGIAISATMHMSQMHQNDNLPNLLWFSLGALLTVNMLVPETKIKAHAEEVLAISVRMFGIAYALSVVIYVLSSDSSMLLITVAAIWGSAIAFLVFVVMLVFVRGLLHELVSSQLFSKLLVEKDTGRV